MNSAAHLDSFVMLWTQISRIDLTADFDKIEWLVNSTGIYPANSAYNVQFIGRTPAPHLNAIWHIKAQGKENAHVFTIAAYTVWNLWTERNRRIFQKESLSVKGVFVLIREEIRLFHDAFQVS
ncbi:hypothetical protein BRADI_3g18974v3 [Brachypodium distachyon]|uniref:Uncharacterized protein n=1 Tax=Brachypodium distachyon TaxID=15368 RepID=A0A2K2CY60_BRADI|nr:hypothetical protein BRADI_3g18974v3 [Brachypodium distachyon]